MNEAKKRNTLPSLKVSTVALPPSSPEAPVMERRVWHYTTLVERFEAILSYGFLLPNAEATDELALLWFSSSQKHEPTSIKHVVMPSGRFHQLTFDEQHTVAGCVRLGLPADDPRLMGWRKACSYAGTPRKMREALERAGRKQGANPAHWFAVGDPVPIEDTVVQIWDGSRWCDLAFERLFKDQTGIDKEIFDDAFANRITQGIEENDRG